MRSCLMEAPPRYLVFAQPSGQTAEVVRTHSLVKAWRVAEGLVAAHGARCVSIIDLDAGVLIPCDGGPSSLPR